MPPYSAVRHLAHSVFLTRAIGRTWMAVMTEITGYFDESGTDERSKHFVIAGYLARTSHWIAFEQEWAEALGSLAPFHMTDFLAGQEQFKNLKTPDRKALMQKLIRIIRTHCTHPIMIGFQKAGYDRLSEGGIFPGMPMPKYSLGQLIGFEAIRRIAERCSYNDPIRVIYDRGAEDRGIILRSYEGIQKRRYRHADLMRDFRLGGFSYEDKEQFSPIQAADVLAHTFQSECRDKIHPEFAALLKRTVSNKTDSLYLNSKKLEHTIKELRKVMTSRFAETSQP